jgi:transcriptional regulator with XRE-family HTH domain
VEEAHRPNELLRHARVLRGWSQQRVADHINAPNRQLVYRWEAGRRSPGPFYRERLCQEFKMTAEELGLVELMIPDPADAAGTVAGDRAGGTTDGAGDSLLPESVNVLLRELWRDEVKRRAVLQMLGALAAGAALDRAPLQRPPIVPVAHASEVADHLARTFPELSTADWLLGPHQVLGTVGGHLDLIEQLLPNLAGPRRVRLLQVGARYAEFASWLNQDGGNLRAATHWADRAMEWAQEVGNPHMVSYVLVRKADQAAASRDAPRTIGLAQSALQHGRRLTSRGRAVALQQLAVGYALVGDEVACQRRWTPRPSWPSAASRTTTRARDATAPLRMSRSSERPPGSNWAGPSVQSTCSRTAWPGCPRCIVGTAASTWPGSPRRMP